MIMLLIGGFGIPYKNGNKSQQRLFKYNNCHYYLPIFTPSLSMDDQHETINLRSPTEPSPPTAHGWFPAPPPPIYTCTLTPELVAKAREELQEKPEWRLRDVQALRDMILKV